ncbi:MAG: hypothetical protein HGA19_18865, partial [Oscillochloris sp.]|nr:hypothetical protein [Oscillochloris sp.]
MFRRAIAAPLAVLLLLVLVAAVLTTTLLRPQLWSVDVGAPGDAYSVVGAYPAEQADGGSLRWTRDSVGLRV